MYRKAKRDCNERKIINFLRRIGASVVQLDDPGVPDLLIGWKNVNILCEVKGDSGTLTDSQQEFFKSWAGQAAVVRSIGDVKRIIRFINNA